MAFLSNCIKSMQAVRAGKGSSRQRRQNFSLSPRHSTATAGQMYPSVLCGSINQSSAWDHGDPALAIAW